MNNLGNLHNWLEKAGMQIVGISAASETDDTAANAIIHYADGFTPTSEQLLDIEAIKSTADADVLAEELERNTAISTLRAAYPEKVDPSKFGAPYRELADRILLLELRSESYNL